MTLQHALNILAILSGVGALVAGLGFAYSQFISGGNKAKDDLIDTLKENLSAEKVRSERLKSENTSLITSHQQQINELRTELSKLQGLFQAAEKEKQNYLQILQGRDPENQRFIKVVLEQIEEGKRQAPIVQKYMTESIQTLAEIKVFMKQLNDKNLSTSKAQ